MSHPVTLLASGTRGDVEPYIALALGLRAAGAPVRVATHPVFAPLVTARGLPYLPIQPNPTDLMTRPGGQAVLAMRTNLVRGLRAALRYARDARPLYTALLSSAARACQGSGVLVMGLASLWGAHIAEALRIPPVWAFLQPFARSRFQRSALLPLGPASWGRLNPVSQVIVEQAAWQPWRAVINRWRQAEAGLRPAPFWGPYPRLYSPDATTLYGYSRAVAPAPPDLPAGHTLTGYWFLDPPSAWSPSPGLLDFLAGGPPPVYLTFGSPGTLDPVQTGALALAALRATGLRGLLALPQDALPPVLPDYAFAAGDVPHAWLFPRLAAAAHHGGAGTTAAALRAGIPSLALPLAVDQFFWAERIHALGAGPRPLFRRDLSVETLAAGLAEAIGSPGLRASAQALAARLGAEDGVSRAVERILPLL